MTCMNGQKIYFFEIGEDMNTTGRKILEANGYIAPRVGEIVSVYDCNKELFQHWEVVNVAHGCNTETKILVSTIHCKLVKVQNAYEATK